MATSIPLTMRSSLPSIVGPIARQPSGEYKLWYAQCYSYTKMKCKLEKHCRKPRTSLEKTWGMFLLRNSSCEGT
jgi:hypothetical protein